MTIEDRLKSQIERLQEEMDTTHTQYKRKRLRFRHADARLAKLRFKREALIEALETNKGKSSD